MAEKDITITYETLFELLRIEKNREDLQKLEGTFFEDVLQYLRDKRATYDSKTADQSVIFEHDEKEKIRLELENIKKIIKDIYDRREKKIVLTAINKSRTGMTLINAANMLPSEKELFNHLTASLKESRANVLHRLVNCESPRPNEFSSINAKILEAKADLDESPDHNTIDSTSLNNSVDETERLHFNSSENESESIIDDTNMLDSSSLGSSENSSSNKLKNSSLNSQEDSKFAENNMSESSLFDNSGNSTSINREEPKELKINQNTSRTGENGVLVRFLEPINEIVGPDLQIYGPYGEGDEVSLPKELSTVLIEKNQAEALN